MCIYIYIYGTRCSHAVDPDVSIPNARVTATTFVRRTRSAGPAAILALKPRVLKASPKLRRRARHARRHPPPTETMCSAGGMDTVGTGTKMYMGLYPENSTDSALRLGNICPDFSAETTQGPMPSFHEWKKDQHIVKP